MKQVEKYIKYQPYLDFIERYKNADNAADGSERDANANVENKNITTMEGELFKGDFIGVNRLAMWQKIKDSTMKDWRRISSSIGRTRDLSSR